MRRLTFLFFASLVLVACGGGGDALPDLRIDSVTPSRGSVLGGTRVTLSGDGIVEPVGGGFDGSLSVSVCGAPLTGLVVAGESRAILLPGGSTATVLVGKTLTGITSASTTGSSEVVVQRPDGQRVVVAGAFACFDPSPLIDVFAATPDQLSRTQSVTYTWQVHDPESRAIRCSLDPGDGHATYDLGDCTAASQTHRYDTAGVFTAAFEVVNEDGVTARASTTVTVSAGAQPVAHDDALATAKRQTLTANLLSDNGSGGDELGIPAATVLSFGGGSLGGAVTDHAAGASVGLAGGTLTVLADGSLTLAGATQLGTVTFAYRLANATGSSDATVTIAVTSPPASLAASTITAGATSMTADGVSSTLIAVQLKDAAGFDLQASAGTVTLSSTAGALSGVTDGADGSYSATLTSPTTVGTATVSGSLNGSALADTATVDFLSGPAASVAKHAGDGATLAVGSTHTLQAKVVDAFGNPVAGHTVGWAVTLGGGSVASPTSLTDAAGVAEVVWTLGGTVGAQGATATAAGLTGSPLGFTVTAIPGAAAALSITTAPSGTAQSGVVLATQPVLQLVDAHGNAVAASGVSVTAAVDPVGGTLAGTTTVATDANGQAAFTDLSVSGLVGSYTLGFSATGLTSATSAPIALTAGAAAQLAIHSGDGQTATAGSAVPTAIAVRVLDVSDNPVAGVSVSFVIASGGGSLTGASATTGADGVATLGSWTLGATAGANTLTASVAGLTDVTFSATGAAGNAANLNIDAGDGGTAVVGTTRTLSASVTDASGNAVAGQTVAWAVTSGGGTLDAVSSNTGADGLAQVVWTLGTVAGSQSVSATATGLNGSPLAFTLTATAGAATQLHIATAPSASTPSGSLIPVQPVIALRDAYDNVVAQSGVDVTATIASGGGTLGGTAVATTDAAGRAAFTDLVLSGTVGVRTLAFTADGLTAATSGDIAVTAGTLAAITASASPAEVLAGGDVTITAVATDDAGNAIANASIGWTSTNGGSFLSATSTTDAGGQATVTFTTSATVGVTHVVSATAGSVVGSTAGIVTRGVPTAADDAPAPTSAPGDAFHTAFETAFTLAAPGLIANDDRGSPAATVLSFGAGDLGGTAADHAAGTTVTPLPGHTTGSLTVGADGSVGFTPPTGFTGLFSFTYRIGNTIGGAAYTSQAQVSIAVGVRPQATDDTYAPALIGNLPIDTSRTSGFSVSTNDVGDALVLASAAETNGTVTLDADGTFTFVPVIGYEGSASFTYTATNGFGTTSPATVTLSVGEPIWFVDASSTTNGDGRLDSPFNCLTGTGCLSGAPRDASDAIYLYSGTYTGRLTLGSKQRLVGQGASQTLPQVLGLTWPLDSTAAPATGGTAPLIQGGVTVGNDNTLRGFDLGNVTTGAALVGSSFGTLTLSEVGITTNGQALDLNGGTLAGSFPRLSSSGGSRNLALTNVKTTTPVALGGASDALSGATSEALLIDGEDGTFAFAGSISKSGGLAVNVRNKSGGAVTLSGSLNPATAGAGIAVTGNGATTVTLSGAAKKINTGTSAGVSLSGNTGSTIAFTGGGLSIATTTGTGFAASGGGTVSVTGTGNTIASSSGMALTVTDTTIAADGLTFVSLASGGSDHGVLLLNTGSGGLTVTGGSAAGSGGTIANTLKRGLSAVGTGAVSLKHMTFTQAANANGAVCNDGDNSGCNAALHFDGVTGVALEDVQVTGSAQMGINLRNVVGFTLANSSVANAGNEAGENGLNFVNVTGTVLIDNVQVTDSRASNLRILNGAGALTLSVTDSTFDGVPASSVDGLQLMLSGAGTTGAVTITDSTFEDNGSAGVYVVAQNGSAGLTLDMSGSTARSNRGGGIIVATQAATGPGPVVDVTLLTNTVSIDTTSGNGIGIRTIGPATLTGTIQGNAVTHSNAAAAGFGISVDADGTAGVASDLELTIDANTIAYTGVNSGIYVATGAAEFTNFAGHIGAVVSNNTITSTSGAYAGIELLLGNAASLCADVRGNASNGATVPAYRFEPFDGTTLGLVGFSGNALTTLNLKNNRRNGGALAAPDVDTTVGTVGACVL